MSKGMWKTQPWKLPQNETFDVLRHEYKNDTVERRFYRLEATMRQSQQTSCSRDSGVTKPPTRRLTPMQFLRKTTEHMPEVLAETSIDHTTVTRTCCAMLRQVRDDIGRQLDIKHFTKYSSEFSEPGFLIMSMTILRESGDAEIVQDRLLKGKRLIHAGPQLEVMGQVLTEFLMAQQMADDSVAKHLEEGVDAY